MAFSAEQSSACLALGHLLKQASYRFTTVTPASHATVVARPHDPHAATLGDIFGWSRAFAGAVLPGAWLDLLEQAGALSREGRLFRSKVRYASLGDDLFLHSAYPTLDQDSVFFGPDTYRFARLVRQTIAISQDLGQAIPHIVDIGCGSGAGGIYAQRCWRPNASLMLADISAKALDHARVNCTLAGLPDVDFRQGDLFEHVDTADLILANPPYLLDAQARVYRDGGGALGSALSTRIVVEGLPRLRPGGTMILYTGVPVIGGVDHFWNGIAEFLDDPALHFSYQEIDPDVFGEELQNPAYVHADRIAAVGLVVRKRKPG